LYRRKCPHLEVRRGLVAACKRAREALQAGLTLQLGWQVGESSLLPAVQLRLAQAVQPVTYAEGCFGHLLPRGDPAAPVLQFGYGGRPQPPQGAEPGVTVDERILERWTVQAAVISASSGVRTK
jgi:hypothetical protein